MNYRGHIVPVMDLAIRLGQSPWSYQIHDHVIVLQHESGLLGMIVNEVQGVHEIPFDTRLRRTLFSLEPHAGRSRFVSHLAKLDTTAIMVLDHELLLSPAAEPRTERQPSHSDAPPCELATEPRAYPSW